jgi:hypothetical protein
MPGELKMNKAEMERGLSQGRILIQEEWAHPQELVWLNELIAEGKAVLEQDWEYHENYQCQRRRVKGVKR